MQMQDQIAQGKLRCVVSGETLSLKDGGLHNSSGTNQYPIFNGVPHILRDTQHSHNYAASNPSMVDEYYGAEHSTYPLSLRERLVAMLRNNYRTRACDQ